MARFHFTGGSIELHEQGSGDPVLLLHSTGASNTQWRALAAQLAARYRVIAPDLYGYGASPHWSGRGAFSLEHEAAPLRALIERLDRPAHLLGHSYGGAVALHLARTRPHALQSLTLIEPVAFHLLRDGDGIDTSALHEIESIAGEVTYALACGDYHAGFGRFVDYWNGPGAWRAIPADRRDALAARLAKVALDFHAALTDPARPDDLRTIAVPALLIQGARTRSPTRRICERLERALPRARLRLIAGAGHMAPLTHREQVNTLIAAHIDTARADADAAQAIAA